MQTTQSLKEARIEFGKMVRERREAQGLTLEDLADEMGYTKSAFANIENGFRRPCRDKIVDICWYLGLTHYEGRYWVESLGFYWFTTRRGG